MINEDKETKRKMKEAKELVRALENAKKINKAFEEKRKSEDNWSRIAGGYEVNDKTGEVRATMKYGSFDATHDRAAKQKKKVEV